MIEQLAKILGISADVLYFYAKRLPKDVEGDADDSQVEEAYRAFRKVLQIDRPGQSQASEMIRQTRFAAFSL